MKFKKMTAFALGLLLSAQGAFLPAFAEETTEELQTENRLGDIDGDGDISVVDARLILHHCALVGCGKESNLTENQLLLADVDKNSVVNAEDAMFIWNFGSMAGTGEIPSDSDISEITERYNNQGEPIEDAIHLTIDQTSTYEEICRDHGGLIPIWIKGEFSSDLHDKYYGEYNFLGSAFGSAIEFGVHVDDRCTFEVVDPHDYSRYAPDESEPYFYFFTEQNENENTAWFSYASYGRSYFSLYYDYYYEPFNLVLLLVKIPVDSRGYDHYDIEFFSGDRESFWTVEDCEPEVSYTDGWIEILPEPYTEPPTQPTTEPLVVSGDINQDGLLSVVDVIQAYRKLLSGKSLPKICDMNHDNKVNIIDIALMKQKLLNK